MFDKIVLKIFKKIGKGRFKKPSRMPSFFQILTSLMILKEFQQRFLLKVTNSCKSLQSTKRHPPSISSSSAACSPPANKINSQIPSALNVSRATIPSFAFEKLPQHQSSQASKSHPGPWNLVGPNKSAVFSIINTFQPLQR